MQASKCCLTFRKLSNFNVVYKGPKLNHETSEFNASTAKKMKTDEEIYGKDEQENGMR